MPHYMIVNIATKEIGNGYTCDASQIRANTPEDCQAFEVPQGFMQWTSPDGYGWNSLVAALSDQVDRLVGAYRLTHITDIPGQEDTYMIKAQEAADYLAASSPVDTDYIYLYAEATKLGMTVADLAAEVIGVRNAWNSMNAKLESERRYRKQQIALLAADAENRNLPDLYAFLIFDWEAIIA